MKERKTLEQRLLSRSCKRLPNDASRQEIVDVGRVKRERKRIMRRNQVLSPVHIFANLSKNHPDYGMTPREHAEAKLSWANG